MRVTRDLTDWAATAEVHECLSCLHHSCSWSLMPVIHVLHFRVPSPAAAVQGLDLLHLLLLHLMPSETCWRHATHSSRRPARETHLPFVVLVGDGVRAKSLACMQSGRTLNGRGITQVHMVCFRCYNIARRLVCCFMRSAYCCGHWQSATYAIRSNRLPDRLISV